MCQLGQIEQLEYDVVTQTTRASQLRQMQNAVMAPSELLALLLFSSNTYLEVPGFSNQTRLLILKRKGCSWKAAF